MSNGESRKNRAGRPPFLEVLRRVDEEVQLLHEHLGGLPRAVEADHILREIWIDDVHNSTAIEGNTMTRAEVQDLVDRRRVSGDLIETLEVEGYAKAADWVYANAAEFVGVPLSVVSEIHRHVVGLVWQITPPVTRDRPGDWRTTDVAIRHVRVSLPPAIPGDLDTWSRSTREPDDIHPIVRAATHHAWFERIHPFVDGNGRVGRLILNFLLIQAGYPPAVILKETRPRYLDALAMADAGNPHPLAELTARSVSGALAKFLIPKLAGEAKLVPLAALATQGPYGASYLRQLAINGRLKSVREGRLYLSSRAWLQEYIDHRDPRGGAPGRRRQTQHPRSAE